MQEYKTDNYEAGKKINYSLPTYMCVVLFLIGSGGLNLVAMLISGIIGSVVSDEMLQANYYLFVSLVNIIAYVIIFAILLAVIYLNEKKNAIARLRDFTDKNTYFYGVRGFGIYYGITIILSILVTAISSLLNITTTDNANQAGIVEMMGVNPVGVFFMVCLLGPICEEFTYRLGLFEALRRKNVILAYVITAIIFGLIHFEFESIGAAINGDSNELINELLNLPSYIAGGVVMCFVYNRRQSIAESITTHVIINLISYIMILIQGFIA